MNELITERKRVAELEERINNRFNETELNINKIELRVSCMESKIDNLSTKIEDIDTKIEDLSKKSVMYHNEQLEILKTLLLNTSIKASIETTNT